MTKIVHQKIYSTLLVNDTSLLGHHGSAIVVDQIIDWAAGHGIKLVTGWDWSAVNKHIAEKLPFDAIIVNGEGSIHDNSDTTIQIVEIAKACKKQKIPAYLINSSEERTGDELIEGLKAFRLRYMRDTTSQSNMTTRGVSSFLAHDLTLSWKDAPRAEGKGVTLITDSSVTNVTKRMIAMSRHIVGTRMISLRTFPRWPNKGSLKRPISFLMKSILSSLMKINAWSLRYRYSIKTRKNFVQLLSQHSQGMITARYHGVCLALRFYLPFVAIEGNIKKIGSLLADVGLSNRLVPLEALENGTRINVMPFSTDEKALIQSFLQRAERETEEMFSNIRQDLDQFYDNQI